jgi:hypothetical protein
VRTSTDRTLTAEQRCICWRLGEGRTSSDSHVAEALVALGANVNLVDKFGRTAFQYSDNEGVSCACLAAGDILEESDSSDEGLLSHQTPMYVHIPRRRLTPQIAEARQRIAIEFVRRRARHVCVGLQSLNLDALQLCEIMMQACGTYGSVFAFHQ